MERRKRNNKSWAITILYIVIFSCIAVVASAQADGIDTAKNIDTASVVKTLLRGSLSGQVRYFFMATDNRKGLSDYYAHAAGLQLHYKTGRYKKVRLGSTGFYAVNIHSADLSQPDSVTRQMNRYELGLFDITDPQRKQVWRLGELYANYDLPSGYIRLGRQFLNTPFINIQDGRMSATAVEALWARFKVGTFHLEGGLITRMSPRSTSEWYTPAASIGLYPQGISVEGAKSNYAGHLASKGILLVGISHQAGPTIKLAAWNQFIDNLFNTTLLQADWEKQQPAARLFAGVQFTHQQRIRDGGNAKTAYQYFTSKASNVMSMTTGWKNSRWEGSASYTHIFKNGRFLMPREWGREPFYTFMPRERNEGLGDVHAWLVKSAYTIKKAGLKTTLQAGYFSLPGVTNYRLNKYAMPSYKQLNASLQYTPSTFLKGVDIQFLYVYKKNTSGLYTTDAVVINKVDLMLYNLVFNYSF